MDTERTTPTDPARKADTMSAGPPSRAPAFLIRDARGLDAYEKAFLFVVASRGEEMFTSAETAAADMGMSPAQFHKVASRLSERELIRREARPGKSSKYLLNMEALATLKPERGRAVTLRKVSTTETPCDKVTPTERAYKGSPTERPSRKVSTSWRGVSTTETHKKNLTPKEKKRARATLRTGPGPRSANNVDVASGFELQVLDLLRQHPKGLFVRNIGEKIKVNSLSARDACKSLEHRNEIHRIDLTDRYFFGPKVRKR
jgi:hypothetical protein